MDPESDDEFAPDSLPPVAPEPSVPEPLRYKPWHRPRKQFVRVEQWMRYIRGIVGLLRTDEAFADNEPLRYLSLPGPDMLDVRMVADYCSQEAIQLRYTGFCYSTENEEQRLRQNVSEFSLSHKDSIVPSSKVVRKKLQDVLVNNSDAMVELVKGGPFDVINIDACDPIANDGADNSGRLVDTIRKITEYQLESRRKPWLLLLTTPIQTDSISAESLDALHGQVRINAERDQQFADELSARFGVDEELDAFLTRLSAQNGDGLLSVFSLGVAKWLIHLAEQAHFKVTKLNAFSYSIFRREPFEPNMVSLSFQFDPLPIAITDQTGLTANPAANVPTTPPTPPHLRALRRSFAIANVDNILRDNQATNDEMINQTKALLSAVGYEVNNAETGYDRWLRDQAMPSHGAEEFA